MRRREQREHIFKLLFISEFNTQKEMEEQLALYLADIENLEESDRDYISRKYMNIMNHTDGADARDHRKTIYQSRTGSWGFL